MAGVVDLSDLVVSDPEGREFRLGGLVDRPTVINVVRYYGCAPCRQQLMELADVHDTITAGGGAVLGIGPRAAYQARLLSERRHIPFGLYLDSDHRVAQAVGLGRQSLLRFIFDLRAWWRWLKGFLRAGQGAITGGWWEVPAIVIVDALCRVQWQYLGDSIGDYPPLTETLAQLDRVLAN
jgi:hypothetical protein